MMMTVPPTVKGSDSRTNSGAQEKRPGVRRWGALRAIVAKDLAESMVAVAICWAAALLGYGYYFVVAARMAGRASSRLAGEFFMFDGAILGSLPITCGLAGFVLAIAQYRSQQRRFEQWAACWCIATMSRTGILCVQDAGGGCGRLYALTVLLPVSVFLMWVVGNPAGDADVQLAVFAALCGGWDAGDLRVFLRGWWWRTRQGVFAGNKVDAGGGGGGGWLGGYDRIGCIFSSVAALEGAAIGVLGLACSCGAADCWHASTASVRCCHAGRRARAACCWAAIAGCWLPAVAAAWAGEFVLGEVASGWSEIYRQLPLPEHSTYVTPVILS